MSCGDFDWNNELYITFTDPFFIFWRIIIKGPFVLNGLTTLLATPLYFSSSRSSSVFTYNQVKQQDNRESKCFTYHSVNTCSFKFINKASTTPDYLLTTKKRLDFDLNNKFTNGTPQSFDLVTCDLDRYVLAAYCYTVKTRN